MSKLQDIRRGLDKYLFFSYSTNAGFRGAYLSYEKMMGLTALNEDNLKQKNIELNYLQNKIEVLTSELEALGGVRVARRVFSEDRRSFVVGRVVYNGLYEASGEILIKLNDAKLAQKVRIEDLVVTGKGLFGRVIGVEGGNVRIIPMFHYLFRVPVYIIEAKAYGVVAGDFDKIVLRYVVDSHLSKKDVNILSGSRVVTSSENSLVQGGVPVGTVVKNIQNGSYRIKPYNNSRELFVTIVASGR